MSQKLIMENWRRFLNENKEQQVLSEEQLQQLEESLAGKSVATAALIFSISTGDASAAGLDGDPFYGPIGPETIADMITTLEDVKRTPSDEGPSDAAIDDVLDALTYVASLPDDQTVKRSDIQRFTAAGPLQLDSYEASQLFYNLTDMALAGELPVQVQGTYGADTGDTGAPDRIPGSSASSATNLAAQAGMLGVAQGKDLEAAKVKAQQLLDIDSSKIQTGTSSEEVRAFLQKIADGQRVTQSDIQTMKASLN